MSKIPDDAIARPRSGDGPLFEEPRLPAPATPAPLFSVSAVLDGFPVSVSVAGSADALLGAISRLKQLGAVPPTTAQAAREEAAREAPICPYHGPMKESVKAPGTFFCPKKMGDGTYCKEKA